MPVFGRNKKTGGLMDEIRCDESSYLIWKWHPSGSELRTNDRENGIRWGSSLRVKDGEVAVFVYKQPDGKMEDFIVGPFDKIIETKNFPVLASIVGLAYEGGTPFQAEVYFINLAQIIQMKFAVPYFDVFDPRFLDFGVPIAVRGTISFKISDYKEFIKLHRLSDFSLETFEHQIRDAVSKYVKDKVVNVSISDNIPVIRIESKINQISDEIEFELSQRLHRIFGVDVSSVDISTIEIDKTSEGYKQLMSVTKDVTMAKIQAETLDYTERLRIQREEGQYSIHKQTQSANLNAFQIEKQTEVGVAGAEALGMMGENNSGEINLGQGTGFNPINMMAGMTLGGAVGQNIATAMSTAMSTNTSLKEGITPPPIQDIAYYVAMNGQATGPYDLNTLKQMKDNGRLISDSLVWKKGMKDWVKAASVSELQDVFSEIPPIPDL